MFADDVIDFDGSLQLLLLLLQKVGLKVVCWSH